MFDPNTDGGSRMVFGMGYGRFFADTLEAGAMLDVQTDDRFESFGAGMYMEKSLYTGTTLIPFVGVSLRFIDTKLNREGGADASANGAGLGLYGGSSIYVHPNIALRGLIMFSGGTDKVFVEKDSLSSTDIRFDFGLAFYF
jgi:hypothetical protein